MSSQASSSFREILLATPSKSLRSGTATATSSTTRAESPLPESIQISMQMHPSPKLSAAMLSALRLDDRMIASDVDLGAEEADEPELGDYQVAIVTEVDYFEETPARNMPGRTGLVKKTLVVKIAEMHLYGDRCHITLTLNLPGGGLQFAHVIPVSFTKSKIRLIEWIVGQLFNSLNIHSSRFLWLLTPDMHWSIDHGLFKLIPALTVLKAILAWLQEIAKLHRGKPDNSCIPPHLQRENVFPPGNFKYHLVLILAHREFVVPRLQMQADIERQTLITKEIGRHKFSMRPINVPLEIPQDYDRGDAIPNQDEKWWATMGNLKGTRATGQLENQLHPKSDEKYANPVLELPQCPVMVTLNAAFWLLKLKDEVEREKETVDGRRVPKTPFDINDFVDPTRIEHSALLAAVLKIADFIQSQRVPGEKRSEFPDDAAESRALKPMVKANSTTTPSRAPSQRSTRSMTLAASSSAGDTTSHDMPPPEVLPTRPRTASNASQGSGRYVLRSSNRTSATDTFSAGTSSRPPADLGANATALELPQRDRAASNASQTDVQAALQPNNKPPRSRTASDASQRVSRPTTRSQTSQFNAGSSVGAGATNSTSVEPAITSPIPSLKRRAKSQGSQARSKRGRINERALHSDAKGKEKAREVQLELGSEEGNEP
ncbi:hypothetical protein PM082_000399 [Marasmius tenuissimus]|nr:hypothetical protein PM082_000399 [Marasmius tenuissimus]